MSDYFTSCLDFNVPREDFIAHENYKGRMIVWFDDTFVVGLLSFIIIYCLSESRHQKLNELVCYDETHPFARINLHFSMTSPWSDSPLL